MKDHIAKSRYETRSFAPTIGGGPDHPTADWLDAVNLGFLVPPAAPDHRDRLAGWLQSDGAVLDGVYATGVPSDISTGPVATLAAYAKDINVGEGRMLAAELIAYVTVRPTHRRRGLLRALMEGALSRAAEKGLPLSALTASEGSIYGRFGYGPATFVRAVSVDASRSFALARPPAGTVEIADAEFLEQHAGAIFDRFHRATAGSVGRPASYPENSIRQYGPDGRPDSSVRVAVHFAPDGSPDGYACYRPPGWTGRPGTAVVTDLVAADVDARIGLWELLASIDMVDTVVDTHSPVDDALRWAVTDPDLVRTTGVKDSVWLRVLDPVAALAARPYSADGALVLAVEDPLGHAAGTFRLSVSDGTGVVERTAGAATPDVRLDVAMLGSLYLGGVDVGTLVAAGRVEARNATTLALASAMFRRDRAPYGVTVF